jgi:Dolichyl-phosphate-mannose-protein mannosyltransferase
MRETPQFTLLTLFTVLLVLSCAVGVRVWYLVACCDHGRSAPPLLVQGENKTELDQLAANIAERSFWVGCATPLGAKEELTAHVAPGYPMLVGGIASLQKEDTDTIVRWLQCVLGSLTAVCYFFFARRAFHSTVIGTLAGLMAAFHPFWIINTAELNDGVLTTFLLGASLMFGTRAGHTGGAFSGFLFGLTLAALCLVRAVMLPFAVLGMLWFLWCCRKFPLGWFAAIMFLFGFINGLVPWFVHCYRVFDRPVPIADSTYLHLWMGNNPNATGSSMDEQTLRNSLPPARLHQLLEEPNQAKRYDLLMHDIAEEIQEHPTAAITRRFNAGLYFLFGAHWFQNQQFAVEGPNNDMPEELKPRVDNILSASLLILFALAFLGWRLSHTWRDYARLGTIAALVIPLPYLVTHAEALSGPRLPYDGVLLCFAAFALASFIPGLVSAPEPAVKAEP